MHGTYLLNLSKKLAGFRHQTEWSGACCFDLGILTGREPDSVLVPAVSIFPDLGPFSLSDCFMTERRPALVIEIASTHDRRTRLEEKLDHYLNSGVETVWVLDSAGEPGRELTRSDGQSRSRRTMLFRSPLLPGFELNVTDLFQAPEWWN
jgi:Uma2 family endonuclease